MKKLIMISLMILLIPAMALSFDKPTAKEAKKVMDYYNEGLGYGAVLIEYELCREMGKDDKSKNDCTLSLSGNDIKVGEDIYLWMNFMIPVNDVADVFVTYTRKNRIRKTQEITLKSAFRYRTWKKIATDKPGEWTIHIFQELGDKDIDLGSLTYAVKE